MNSAAARAAGTGGPRNQEATLYVGNLDERAGEPLLRELFVQFAPVVSVSLPRDRVTGATLGFAFVELPTATDAEYVMRVLPGTKLYGRPLRINRAHAFAPEAAQRGHQGHAESVLDVGAHVFVGNLDPARADASFLASVFSRFGPLVGPPEVVTDASGDRAHAIVCMASFEAADAAIAALDSKPLADRVVRVTYAYRKDGKPGERHGGETERRMAAQLRAYSGFV